MNWTELSVIEIRYIDAMRNHSIVFILFLLLGSCVSVQLPGGKVTSAKDVQLTPPPPPFKEITSSNSDKAWLSQKTGNTISYLSECGNTNEPTLQQIEMDSLSALSNVQSLKNEDLNYNGRAARLSTHKGDLDGVPVQLTLLIFKKNGCSYTLSFGGLSAKFASEETQFKSFIESFRAP